MQPMTVSIHSEDSETKAPAHKVGTRSTYWHAVTSNYPACVLNDQCGVSTPIPACGPCLELPATPVTVLLALRLILIGLVGGLAMLARLTSQAEHCLCLEEKVVPQMGLVRVISVNYAVSV